MSLSAARPPSRAFLSADARYVAFSSIAGNLAYIPPAPTACWQVYVRDRFGADFDQDGQLGGADIFWFIMAWKQFRQGEAWDRTCDMDGDGRLTRQDARILLEQMARYGR